MLVDLSLLQHHLGDYPASLEISSTALEIMEQFNRPKYIGQALTQAGRALAGLDNLEAAERKFLGAKDNFSHSDQVNLQMEPQAGLASIFLARADSASALMHAEQILNHLDASRSSASTNQQDQIGAIPGLEGTHDPMWIFLVCCQVLSNTGDSRAANLIKTAHELIQHQASKISDLDLHYSFLNNVKANQKIQSLFTQGGVG